MLSRLFGWAGSQDEAPRYLCSLADEEYKVASSEEILKMAIREGGEGLVDLRVYGAAQAARFGRMDLLTHFIEKREVPVNTITKEERAVIDNIPAVHLYLKDKCLFTPLSLALLTKQEPAITYLLDRMQKAETETTGPYGLTCLTVAVQYGNLGAVRRLVMEFDADYINVRTENNHSPLCHAVQKGQVDVVDIFLEHARTKEGESGRNRLLNHPCPCTGGLPSVYSAILNGQLPLVQYIAEKEGKKHFINVLWEKNINGSSYASSALHAAAATGKLDIVKWLCEQGASVNFAIPASKYTPLHSACMANGKGDQQAKLSLVKYLIEEQHADWQPKTDAEHTAADLAREAGNNLIEAYLKGVEQKAKRKTNAKGKTEKELRLTADLDAEKIRLAAVAADQAAAAILAELDAEAAATAARKAKAMKASAAKKKKKAQRQGGKKDDKNIETSSKSTRQEKEEEKEKGQKGEDDLGVASSSVAAVAVVVGELSIEEKADTATSSAAAETAVGSLQINETDDGDAFEEFLLEGAPDALVCPISFRLLTDPVLAQDTHTYDRKSLEQWMERCKAKGQELISPKNNLPMAEGMMCNQIVRTMALDYMEAKKKEWEEAGGGKMKG